MESIEKLREIVKSFHSLKSRWDTLAAIDEVEREIERDYMKLPEGWTTEQASEIIGYWPKWDDGEPCMFGDRFTTPKYAFEENAETFDRLVIYARDHVFKHADGTTYEGEHGGYYEWNYFRPGGDGCEEYRPHHVKPRTIEDVLEKFGNEYIRVVESPNPKIGFGNVVIGEEEPSEVIAKYADELCGRWPLGTCTLIAASVSSAKPAIRRI